MKLSLKSFLFSSLALVFVLPVNGCHLQNESLQLHQPDFKEGQNPPIIAKNHHAGMPNPWINCQDSLTKAAEISGFSFPLLLSNYTVRAMKDLIEIRYPLDETRYLLVRKGKKTFAHEDISGNYHYYPKTEKTVLDNQMTMTLRRDGQSVYVMLLTTDMYLYSVNCQKGMTLEEVRTIYQVIAEAENLPQNPFIEKKSF